MSPSIVEHNVDTFLVVLRIKLQIITLKIKRKKCKKYNRFQTNEKQIQLSTDVITKRQK